MFLEPTYQLIKGYDIVRVEGYFVERFLNLCMSRNVSIWNVKKISEIETEIKTFQQDFHKLKTIANITKCRITIVSQKGGIHVLKQYQKRIPFLITVIGCLLMIYQLSTRIWQIEIAGEFTIPIDELCKELKEENVKIGMRKKDLDFDTIKSHIYRRRNDVVWMGFDVRGVKAIVSFVERTNIEDNSVRQSPCHVVSNQEGIVEKIFVREGTKVVEEGDFVQSGDVLISGKVTSLDGTIRMVHSDGEILLKTWYVGKATIPFEKDVPMPTGKKEYDMIVKFGNIPIKFRNNGTNFEKYDTIRRDEKLLVFQKYQIPIELMMTIYQELEIETIFYQKEQALELAKRQALWDLQRQRKVHLTDIPEDCMDVQIDDNAVTVTITVACIESVGVKNEITR